MIPQRTSDSTQYPREQEREVESFSSLQWVLLTIIYCVSHIFDIMTPTLALSRHSYFFVSTVLMICRFLGIFAVPFIFGGGVLAREALRRLRGGFQASGIALCFLIPVVSILFAALEMRSFSRVLLNHPFGILSFHSGIGIGYTLLALVETVLLLVGSVWIRLLLVTPRLNASQYFVIAYFGVISTITQHYGNYFYHQTYSGLFGGGRILYSENWNFWIVNIAVGLISSSIALVLLAKMFRPSMAVAAAFAAAASLRSLLFESPTGWYFILAQLFGIGILVYFYEYRERYDRWPWEAFVDDETLQSE